MTKAELEKAAASFPVVVVSVDARGRVSVREAPKGRKSCVQEIAPELNDGGDSGTCDEPLTKVQKAPVLLTLSTLAPLLDPTLWGDFTLVKTFDQVVERPCAPEGWIGTITERVDTGILYLNILNIAFCYSDTSSQADFSLNEALKGPLAVDEGYLQAQPGEDFSWIVVKKTVNFVPGSVFCKMPRESVQVQLDIFVLIFVIQYALGVMLAAAEEGLDKADRALWESNGEIYLKELEAYGFDPETNTFSGTIDVLNDMAEAAS